MKIVADSKIPYINGLLENAGHEVVYLPGAQTTARDVRDAQVLLTRTRTRCDRSLLEGSRVEFIGTATIGTD
ncbi:MAG: erythronate-4-phosphate dehydrogenase, partial [Muribaculaceae bacterium]|nr:erythronate-4-phosphate dehydrogenase [Muribaculaceae bacterium]